jgi:hypothetical protein
MVRSTYTGINEGMLQHEYNVRPYPLIPSSEADSDSCRRHSGPRRNERHDRKSEVSSQPHIETRQNA